MGFLAALAAMLLAWIPEGKFDIHHAFLLCASSVLTAALASFILGKPLYGYCPYIFCYSVVT